MALLIDYNDNVVCPRCRNIPIVSYDDSIKIIQHYIEKCEKIFDWEIRQYARNKLIKDIFWEREKQMRTLMKQYTSIDSDKLASTSYLIRKLFIMNKFSTEKRADSVTIKKIISDYTGIMNLKTEKIKLEAKNSNMVISARYDINHMEDILLDKIKIYHNENYGRLIQAFANNSILSEESARMKIQEQLQYLRHAEIGSNRTTSIRETIKRFHELIGTLYVAFLRNKVHEEAFLFPGKNISINPIDLRIFNGRYPTSADPTELDFQCFNNNLILIFKQRYKEVICNFVLSKDHPNAFPLFLKLGNTIILSQAFGELYCYFLHAIINKKEFDKETERLSKIFEQEIVKKYFEELGFRYFTNVGVKNKLEIDGVAISKQNVYVVEVKGWGSRKLLEEKTSREIITRDIKSAISGIRINVSHNNIKLKPSIRKKVKWIAENRKMFEIKEETPIIGLLVINEQPTITEYSNCKIIRVSDRPFG